MSVLPAASVAASVARALALVLAVALLREGRVGPTLSLARLHLGATAVALLAAAPLAPGARAAWLVAAGLSVAATARLSTPLLGALEARTGAGADLGPTGAAGTIAWIAPGLVLVMLAVSLLGRLRSEAAALALATALLGLLLALRPGGPVAALARIAVLGDGIALLAAALAAAVPTSASLPAFAPLAGALLMPALLLLGRATLGRVGGAGAG